MPPPTSATVQKRTKIQQVLKAAGHLPRFPAINIKSGLRRGVDIGRNNSLSPGSGETPAVILRLQVLGCSNLQAKDSINPFVVVSILNKKSSTPVSKRNLSPIYSPKDATFDFPIYLSLADRLGVLELVVWDKQILTKEYLGEVAIPLEDWFADKDKDGMAKRRAYEFDQPVNESFSLDLVSTRTNIQMTGGSIQVKLGFAPTSNTASQDSMTFEDVYDELLRRTKPSLISAPPTEGVGTFRSRPGFPFQIQFEDDGGLSDSGSDAGGEETEIPPEPKPLLDVYTPPSTSAISTTSGPLKPASNPIAGSGSSDNVTTSPTKPSASAPWSKAMKFTPIKILRRFSGLTGAGAGTQAQVQVQMPAPPDVVDVGARILDVVGTTKKKKREFAHGKDLIGAVMLEIEGADDLPKWPNATHTGWDMDPFVVVAFSKKVFRTRVVRHSLNPVFEEKLFFHVRRSETSFQVQLTVLDWDKLTANDLVGDATFEVKELIEDAPKPDGKTGLYAHEDEEEGGEGAMRKFRLELATVDDLPGGVKPVIRFRAKYYPYAALRQRFWRHYLSSYDTGNTGALSRLEIAAMLDSLGSTLSRNTISKFFTRYGKDPKIDEITVDQAIICLEEELNHPDEERRKVSDVDGAEANSNAEPVVMVVGEHGEEVKLNLDLSFGGMHFSGPPHVVLNGIVHETHPMQMSLEDAAAGPAAGTIDKNENADDRDTDADDDVATPNAPLQAIEVPSSSKPILRECIVNVHNCPFCHCPGLGSKPTIDAVTHIALCASHDWNKVNRIMVGNFVTASEAERKWYMQVIMDIAAGEYKLGANSANVIVQNRTTGQLEEEKMQVYVRLGIRLLYKGFLSEMESEAARKLLKSLSIKQGLKYDDPESAKEIPTFIKFHGLDIDELLDPLNSFKTFNQFFYRKLKPSARPIDSPNDPYRIVSAADCRLLAFDSVSHATRLWIKGREFSVARLLGDAYKDDVERYTGGALAIFRLAPQDYHRFHSPVEGRVGRMTYIAGEYYTVNPQAIRTALDVYGENARKIVPIHSPQFGQVMAVCIGAMMVGSIQTTVAEEEYVQRGQEFGYFAFGGSTIVFLFEKGRIEWDEDLLINGQGCLETLVRVGMGIGRGRQVEE